MTRAAAATALARLGLAAPPPLGPELTPALAPPADPAPCAPRPPPPPTRAAHVHVHARGLALRYGGWCWVAAAVGFTRRSLTRGRARGNFSHKAFFLSLFFFSFAKLTFTPFHFSPVVSIPSGLLVLLLLLHSSLFSRLVKVLGFCRWFSPLVAAVPKEGKRSSCGRIGKVF